MVNIGLNHTTLDTRMYQFVLAIPRDISFGRKFEIKPVSIKYFKFVSKPGHISDLYLLNISIDGIMLNMLD